MYMYLMLDGPVLVHELASELVSESPHSMAAFHGDTASDNSAISPQNATDQTVAFWL